MCATCDYSQFVQYDIENRGNKSVRLKNDKIELEINCDSDGKNYKIGEFTIYRCPTCGRKLW